MEKQELLTLVEKSKYSNDAAFQLIVELCLMVEVGGNYTYVAGPNEYCRDHVGNDYEAVRKAISDSAAEIINNSESYKGQSC